MKAESTIFVSLAIGIASVCLLMTSLNMYMLSSMRTTLTSLDERITDDDGSDEPHGIYSALIRKDPSDTDKDELITALYRHLDQQNNQIAQYEMRLHHLAELHEHHRQLLEQQEALRQQHLKSQKALEAQKRKLSKKMTKLQLEKQAHEHRKEIDEYERQLQQTLDQLYELQRRQEANQPQPIDDPDFPQDVPPFTGVREDEFPFSPVDLLLSQIFGGGMFYSPDEEDLSLDPIVTVSLDTVKDADTSRNDLPDFGDEPAPVEDADVLADSDSNHFVVHRVLPELDEEPETTPMPPNLPTPVA